MCIVPNKQQLISDPREPKNTTIITSRFETEITINGSTTAIEAEAGSINQYDIQSITPNHGTNDGPANADNDLNLNGLTPGEVYTIELKSVYTVCSNLESKNYTTITECTGMLNLGF